MIVNDGKQLLLTAEQTFLATCQWGLFTNNVAIINTTTFAALTEAAWAGYAGVLVGALGAVALVANKAVTIPTTSPSFGNTSGANQSFFGWFLKDPASGKLVAAVNIGNTTIANGATYPLAAAITDDQA